MVYSVKIIKLFAGKWMKKEIIILNIIYQAMKMQHLIPLMEFSCYINRRDPLYINI